MLAQRFLPPPTGLGALNVVALRVPGRRRGPAVAGMICAAVVVLVLTASALWLSIPAPNPVASAKMPGSGTAGLRTFNGTGGGSTCPSGVVNLSANNSTAHGVLHSSVSICENTTVFPMQASFFGNVSSPSMPVFVNLTFGDGSTQGLSIRSNATWSAGGHIYAHPGNYSVTITATDAAGRVALLATTIVANGANGGGGPGCGWSLSGNLPNGSSSRNLSVAFALCLNGAAPNATLSASFNVSGPSAPYRARILWGDSTNQSSSGNSTPWRPQFRHLYTGAATYTLSAQFNDSSGRGALLTEAFTVRNLTANTTCVAAGSIGASSPRLLVSIDWCQQNFAPNASFVAHLNVTRGVSPYYVTIGYGDGSPPTNLTANGSTSLFSVSHVYAVPGNYSFSARVRDLNNSSLLASGVIGIVNSFGSTGGGSGGGGGGGGGCRSASGGSLSNGTLVVGFSICLNSTGPNSVLVAAFNVSGGSTPYREQVVYGDGSPNSTLRGNTTPAWLFHLRHNYTVPGTYTFSSQTNDSSGLGVLLTVGLQVPNASGGGGGTPHNGSPAPVAVVVDATPVTGVAPLNVSFSAFINGGAPPFTVVWSLPVVNATLTPTGLETSHTYGVAGWYPATAFVYNTTTTAGRVLVGEGSVWVDVLANNSTGNGSGHHLPGPSRPAGSGGPGGSSMTEVGWLIVGVAATGIAGGAFAGYLFGGHRRAGTRVRPGVERRSRSPADDARPPPPGA